MKKKTRDLVLAFGFLVFGGLILLGIGVYGGYMGYKLSRIIHQTEQYTTRNNIAQAGGVSSGDLLLFSANLGSSFEAALTGGITMLKTDSPWTHVSVAVRNPATGLLYSVELTLESSRGVSSPAASPTPPPSAALVRSGKTWCAAPGVTTYFGAGKGMCILPLGPRAQHYNGSIFVRKLLLPSVSFFDETAMWKAALDLLAVSYSREYNLAFFADIWHRIGIPGIPLMRVTSSDHPKSSSSAWICTDLVSSLLHQYGIFETPRSNMLPVDFGSEKENMPLAKGIHYDVEQPFIFSSAQ